MHARRVFLSGGTGYLGQPLSAALISRGHAVASLVRPGSERRLAAEVAPIAGNALDFRTFAGAVQESDTFVHLTGTPKPAPWKGRQFRAVDLASLQASVEAGKQAGIKHFVYVSVAHPAPVMRTYIAVRQECEDLLRASALHTTILRPWYVLGPGHWWPSALKPVYAALGAIPRTRAASRRLGLVTLPEMVAALTRAVEQPAVGVRVVEVPEIRFAD